MSKKIIVHTKAKEEPSTTPVPEQYNAYVEPNTQPIWDGKKLYTGKKPTGWMILWWVMCFFHIMSYVGNAADAMQLPFFYLLIFVAAAVSLGLSVGFSIARNKIFRHLWVVYIVMNCVWFASIGAASSVFGWTFTPTILAIYFYKSKKVNTYLCYKGASIG
jgi:hypothetical protein